MCQYEKNGLMRKSMFLLDDEECSGDFFARVLAQ